MYKVIQTFRKLNTSQQPLPKEPVKITNESTPLLESVRRPVDGFSSRACTDSGRECFALLSRAVTSLSDALRRASGQSSSSHESGEVAHQELGAVIAPSADMPPATVPQHEAIAQHEGAVQVQSPRTYAEMPQEKVEKLEGTEEKVIQNLLIHVGSIDATLQGMPTSPQRDLHSQNVGHAALALATALKEEPRNPATVKAAISSTVTAMQECVAAFKDADVRFQVLHDVSSNYLTFSHMLAIGAICAAKEFAISARKCGPDTIERLNDGAATKPHAVLQKSINRDRLIGCMPSREAGAETFERLRRHGLNGVVGDWRDPEQLRDALYFKATAENEDALMTWGRENPDKQIEVFKSDDDLILQCVKQEDLDAAKSALTERGVAGEVQPFLRPEHEQAFFFDDSADTKKRVLTWNKNHPEKPITLSLVGDRLAFPFKQESEMDSVRARLLEANLPVREQAAPLNDESCPLRGIYITDTAAVRNALLSWNQAHYEEPVMVRASNNQLIFPIDPSSDQLLERSLAPLKSIQEWKTTVLSGDYDLHDAFSKHVDNKGERIKPTLGVQEPPQETRLPVDLSTPPTPAHEDLRKSPEHDLNLRLNKAVAVVDQNRPMTKPSHWVIQHGPQQAYKSYMKLAARGKPMVAAVVNPSFPLAFCKDGEWFIVHDQAEYRREFGLDNSGGAGESRARLLGKTGNKVFSGKNTYRAAAKGRAGDNSPSINHLGSEWRRRSLGASQEISEWRRRSLGASQEIRRSLDGLAPAQAPNSNSASPLASSSSLARQAAVMEPIDEPQEQV